MVFAWPYRAAIKTGVSLLLLGVVMFAPNSAKAWVAASWPCAAAAKIGVSPLLLGVLTLLSS